MYDTKITSTQAKAFVEKHGEAMAQVKEAFKFEVERFNRQTSLDDYICKLEADIERDCRQMKNQKAVELAEKNADKLPSIFIQYRFDEWRGATRLSFESYLPFIATQRVGKGRVSLAT